MEFFKNKFVLIGLGIIATFAFLYAAWALTSTPAKEERVNIQLSSNERITGNKDAKITLLEYSDFQCPACKAFHPVVKELVRKYAQDIRLVYRHFPLTQVHKNARAAALAAEAANMQGKFFEYHDTLFENQEEWGALSDPTKKFVEYAKRLKLDTTRFAEDMKSPQAAAKIKEDGDSALKVGIQATPTFILNGLKLTNLKSYADLEAAIKDEILKQKNTPKTAK